MASNKLKKPSLSKTILGYDIDETNRYISYVFEKYNSICRENSTLKEKYSNLFLKREQGDLHLSHLSAEVLLEMIDRENEAHSNAIKGLTEALKNASKTNESVSIDQNIESSIQNNPIIVDEKINFVPHSEIDCETESISKISFDPIITYDTPTNSSLDNDSNDFPEESPIEFVPNISLFDDNIEEKNEDKDVEFQLNDITNEPNDNSFDIVNNPTSDIDDFSEGDPDVSNTLRSLFHIEDAPSPAVQEGRAKSAEAIEISQKPEMDSGDGDFYPSWMNVDGENFDPNTFTQQTAYKNYSPSDIKKLFNKDNKE